MAFLLCQMKDITAVDISHSARSLSVPLTAVNSVTSSNVGENQHNSDQKAKTLVWAAKWLIYRGCSTPAAVAVATKWPTQHIRVTGSPSRYSIKGFCLDLSFSVHLRKKLYSFCLSISSSYCGCLSIQCLCHRNKPRHGKDHSKP